MMNVSLRTYKTEKKEMKYEITPYPCELKQGDKVKTADGRIREVEYIDGRFIKFKDGTLYGIKHPDIIGLAVEKKKKKKETTEE